MAMITCPECGRTISDRAPVCIGCGITREIMQEILAKQTTEEVVKPVEPEEIETVSVSKIIESTQKVVGMINCVICKTTYDGSLTKSCPKCDYPYFFLCDNSALLEKERNAYRKKMSIEEITLKTGQSYRFGHYQEEEINWRVLAVDNDKALLITEQAIDARSYNKERETITWENSTLRKWLNGEFYRSTFTDQEKGRILETNVRNRDNESYGTDAGDDTGDRVFLLSIEEANKLFRSKESRACNPTPYAKENGCWTNGKKNCWWWLRSPGRYGGYAAYITGSGDVFEDGGLVNVRSGGLRPALWISLETDCF